MHEQRLHDLRRFYSILDRLEESNGGARKFGACSGRMDWPERGVYFIRECGEECADSRSGPRIVRVGTHALKAGSGTRRLPIRSGQSAYPDLLDSKRGNPLSNQGVSRLRLAENLREHQNKSN